MNLITKECLVPTYLLPKKQMCNLKNLPSILQAVYALIHKSGRQLKRTKIKQLGREGNLETCNNISL